MSVVSIPSLGIFDPAIAYHAASLQFLSDQGEQISSCAKAVSDELHVSCPQQADEFDYAMKAVAQRFTDEAQLSGEALAYLTSHYEFLANREGILSGSASAPTPPNPPIPDTSSWLDIHRTPVHGCFDELERILRASAQELNAFEQRVQDFERIVWVAVNQPDQLKLYVDVPSAGWEPDWLKDSIQGVANAGTAVAGDTSTMILRPAIDFIQAHQYEIYNMLDQMRKGYDTILVPRTDPGVLQELIDYFTALRAAYDRFIRALFEDATRPVATAYQPPAGQDSYQQAWPTIPRQQYQTSMALGNAISQLQ